MNILDDFFEKVSLKNTLQKRYLNNSNLLNSEKQDLESILSFFIEELNYNVEFLADAYLFINEMVMEETYYFRKTGKYRNSSFEEVNRIVYANADYMEKYMTGLTVSDYIWTQHIKMLRYFSEKLADLNGNNYLEIGPGFGQYLSKAIESDSFNNYRACDVSRTSVDKCNKYLKYRKLADKCIVEHNNFFDFNPEEKFDCIVMGEVLEHVEQPMKMLEKIYELLNKNGKAFITTVVNAPTVDHIYLFGNIDQVLELTKQTGFKVCEYQYFTEGELSLERAEKKGRAIDIAMVLAK